MLPPAKSTLADETDALFNFINVASLIFLVGITIAIIYFSWKYRRRSDQDVTPVIAHNSKLEITWSVIPLVLVLIVLDEDSLVILIISPRRMMLMKSGR